MDSPGGTLHSDLPFLVCGGEGACAPDGAGRSHLPLRGKLGWMTPGPARLGRHREACSGGSCSQAGAPLHFRPTCLSGKWIHPPLDRYPGLPQSVRHLRFLQPRRIVFERQELRRLVEAKPPQPIGVREASQASQLLRGQGRLQFVGDFQQRHALDYNRAEIARWPGGGTRAALPQRASTAELFAGEARL